MQAKLQDSVMWETLTELLNTAVSIGLQSMRPYVKSHTRTLAPYSLWIPLTALALRGRGEDLFPGTHFKCTHPKHHHNKVITGNIIQEKPSGQSDIKPMTSRGKQWHWHYPGNHISKQNGKAIFLKGSLNMFPWGCINVVRTLFRHWPWQH